MINIHIFMIMNTCAEAWIVISRKNNIWAAVAAGEDVVSASELAAAIKQINQLQRLPGKKTMEVEILKEAVEYAQSRKWIAHVPLLPSDKE